MTESECFFCCELGAAVAPSQEVVFVRVLVEQLDLQVLPRVVVNQGLETQMGASLRHTGHKFSKTFFFKKMVQTEEFLRPPRTPRSTWG